MQAFMDLLTRKPLDKITVKDIIEEADINRNTFYYYYENIPDLLDAYFAYELQKFSESTEKSDSFAREYNPGLCVPPGKSPSHSPYLSFGKSGADFQLPEKGFPAVCGKICPGGGGAIPPERGGH